MIAEAPPDDAPQDEIDYSSLPQLRKLQFRSKRDGQVYDYVAPSNKYELQRYLEQFCGLIIPDKAVCPTHCAPLDAAWAAYCAEESIIVIKASRGLGGKSSMLAGLSILEMVEGMNVAILGGSSQQSQRVHEVAKESWDHVYVSREAKTNKPNGWIRGPLRNFLSREPLTWKTITKLGNWMRALTASTRSARGPHPQRLRLDEVDEMDLVVFDASMGQTMKMKGRTFKPQTLISSTHQYPDGTFTEILKRAKMKGWPIFEWCYRENLTTNGGWLDPSEVDRKRNEVTQAMWDIEFELQEPSSEGRAFDTDAIRHVFSPKNGKVEDKVGKRYIFEKPKLNAKYAHGADWAKKKDYTVIVTIRYDCEPAMIVAYERIQRRPWPVMIARLDERIAMYGGRAAHDATGVGDVAHDYLEEDAAPVIMAGAARKELFTDWILAVEQKKVASPNVQSLRTEHEYCTSDDLYGSGRENHPPDSVVAAAMAWRVVLGKQYGKDKRPGRLMRPRTW